MKSNIKYALSFVLCIMSIVFCVHYLSDKIVEGFNTEASEYEEHIGETCTINKDTLIIVDYSLLKESFTLSDGREVNRKLIIK